MDYDYGIIFIIAFVIGFVSMLPTIWVYARAIQTPDASPSLGGCYVLAAGLLFILVVLGTSLLIEWCVDTRCLLPRLGELDAV